MAEVTTQTEQTNKALLDKEGKYLTFALANEEYGLEILKVREIIGYMEITAVPQTPEHVKGVINLRGQVIPVIDLRAKFGMETTDVTEETCIIVVEITQGDRKFSTGIVVDHVQEVLDIAGEDIEEPPQFGSSVNTDFILGMGKIGDSVKILLDIDKVLSGDNIASFGGGSGSYKRQECKSRSKKSKSESQESEPESQEGTPKDQEQG
jgi:purine-binding chemotaxis protein CheW